MIRRIQAPVKVYEDFNFLEYYKVEKEEDEKTEKGKE
jgi:hypothetical protein